MEVSAPNNDLTSEIDQEWNNDFVNQLKKSLSNYNLTNLDCPQLEIRKFIPCKSIKQGSEFCERKIYIQVPSYEIKKGTWYIGDYSVFSIETKI